MTVCIHETGFEQQYSDYDSDLPSIKEGLDVLDECDVLVGHNIIGYDLPVIKKLTGVEFIHNFEHIDTMLLSQICYTGIEGGHSLKAWGKRLREYKGEFNGPWDTVSEEMLKYNKQDVIVTVALYNKLLPNLEDVKKILDFEQNVCKVITDMSLQGFNFDKDKAEELYGKLCGIRKKLKDELKDVFPAWYKSEGEFIPKSNGKYQAGQPLTKVKLIEFNPASRNQIIDRFKKYHNWRPREFTEKGSPKINDTVLESLDYPEAKKLVPFFVVNKRLGQLAEGNKAWLKLLHDDGKIHGSLLTNGTITGRMLAFNPNMQQVPANDKPWGKACRSLFIPEEGKVLVGVDASGLEARALAHYMYPHDKGEYANLVINGDVHQHNADLLGVTREQAKTIIYAYIYGAGDKKLGFILLGHAADRTLVGAGSDVRARLESSLPALDIVTKGVRKTFESRGYLHGLDGRKLIPRSNNSALNTLIQSAGAVIMKQSLLFFEKKIRELDCDAQLVAMIHDEFQLQSNPNISEKIGQLGVDSIVEAGVQLGIRCPLDGAYKVGESWQHTH